MEPTPQQSSPSEPSGPTPTAPEPALLHQWLGMALDISGKVVVVTDHKGNIEYVNAAFVRSSGYSAKEVLGQNPRVLKSGLMTEEVYRRMWATLQGGLQWSGELLNRKRNGELYWEHVTIAPIIDEKGARYLAVKENITERKLLRGRLEMFQGVMRVLSSDENVQKTAPRLTRILTEALSAGWVELWVLDEETQELVCMGSYEINSGIGKVATSAQVGSRIRRGANPRFTALEALSHVRLHSGDARQQMAFPIRNEQGGAGVFIIGDLINTQSVAPAIELVCAQLGHYLQRARMERQLIQARDIAEAASKAKSAFLSNMSNELRTPINEILAQAQRLRSAHAGDPSTLEQAEEIERNGMELLSLINAILDISKVVSTQSSEHKLVHDTLVGAPSIEAVRTLLEATVQSQAAKAGGVETSCATAEPVETPKAGPRKLHLILARIKDATTRADIEVIRQLNGELAKEEPELALQIKQCTEMFDYESIARLLVQAAAAGRLANERTENHG